MVCNVLTPFVSLVQSTLKVIPNFGSTTKGSVPPSCDGTTIVRRHEIVAMVPRCLFHPGNHFQVIGAPKRKPTEPPEGTPVDVESLATPAPSTSCVHEPVHPVQFGIMPKRLPFPHPDDEILSGHEEDVPSIQNGYTAWVRLIQS